MAEVTWHKYWSEYGPDQERYDELSPPSATKTDEERDELQQIIDDKKEWDRNGGVDYLYGYTKHVAVVIAHFCIDVELGKDNLDPGAAGVFESMLAGGAIESWNDLGDNVEYRINKLTVPDVRIVAKGMLIQLEAKGMFDTFDECVLPIKPRPHGTVPRAFLGSDVAESGEGLGFMENKLRRYLRHPGMVPKSQLLNWDSYERQGSEKGELANKIGWFYSIKYDGWSAIWTGTKLVTANGRQTITAMPEAMQSALLSVRSPLVGEIVIMQRPDGSQVYTKERLQAIVRGNRTADKAGRDEIAKRIVFMVYDTPSTELAFENFEGRKNELEKLLTHSDGTPFTVKEDRVALVEQIKVSGIAGRPGYQQLGEALLAATATEHEGVMLTPNKPYLALYTGKYKRRKLKPLFQFSVFPEQRTAEKDGTDEPVPVSGARFLNSITVNIDNLPAPFQKRGDPSKMKINLEGGAWIEPKGQLCIRLSKHRWGFCPVVTSVIKSKAYETLKSIALDTGVEIDSFEELTPYAIMHPREMQEAWRAVAGTRATTSSNQLWNLVANHFIHPSVFDSHGRPQYPTYAPSDEILDPPIAHKLFYGEMSSETVRGLVREASMLAERSPKQPYNEWLCRIHRAYENQSLWRTTVRANSSLADPPLRLKVRARSRLPLIPFERFQPYYILDVDSTPQKRNSVYKLITLDVVPESGPMFEELLRDWYYVPEGETDLPPRILYMEFDIISKAKIVSWKNNSADLINKGFNFAAARRVNFTPSSSKKAKAAMKNYVLSLIERDDATWDVVEAAENTQPPGFDGERYALIAYGPEFYLAQKVSTYWEYGDGTRQRTPVQIAPGSTTDDEKLVWTVKQADIQDHYNEKSIRPNSVTILGDNLPFEVRMQLDETNPMKIERDPVDGNYLLQITYKNGDSVECIGFKFDIGKATWRGTEEVANFDVIPIFSDD